MKNACSVELNVTDDQKAFTFRCKVIVLE